MKHFRLVALTMETSKYPNIDSIMRLLVFIIMKIYNEKEQDEQGKVQMYSSRGKLAQGSEKEIKPVFKEINRLMKILMINEIKGMVTSGKGTTQLNF